MYAYNASTGVPCEYQHMKPWNHLKYTKKHQQFISIEKRMIFMNSEYIVCVIPHSRSCFTIRELYWMCTFPCFVQCIRLDQRNACEQMRGYCIVCKEMANAKGINAYIPLCTRIKVEIIASSRRIPNAILDIAMAIKCIAAIYKPITVMGWLPYI